MPEITSILEILMLVSFGFAWPSSIYKSYISRTAKGKSLSFLLILLFGYICGIINKIIQGNYLVLTFYILDFIMVSIDTCLYFRNRKLDKIGENR